jgi:isoquinoline 1-oxidoreductase beta subunit
VRRRAFLGATAATLTVTFVGAAVGSPAIPVIPRRPQPQPGDATAWIRHRDGRFELFVPCAEMGQHIGQSLRRVAAAELDVPLSRIALRAPSSRDIPRVRATVGSDSIKDFAPPLARACAVLREALAAGRTSGRIDVTDWGSVTTRSLRPDAPRAPDPERTHLRAIVTGAPLYAADQRVAGMAYGRVLRAPVSPELPSHPESWNEAAGRAVPGFVAVVADPLLSRAGSLGLGIVAETPGALDRIERALATRWQVEGRFQPAEVDATLDVDAHLGRGRLRHRLRDDPIDVAAPWTIDLRLDVPFAAHAAIEPRAALASFGPDDDGHEHLRIATGTQDLFYVRDVLSRRLSIDAERVLVQACRIGGGFGARTLVLVELEAAVLARATRRPVKAMWTREQEFIHGFHRPPSSHRTRASVHQGRLVTWWHAFTSSHILFTPAAMPVWMQRAADFVGDRGVARGAELAYTVPKQRIEFDALRLPVHGGPWRGLGAGPNGLAVESAIDACAHAAGIDPLDFRLAHIDDPRLTRALRVVAEDARWPGARASARDGRRHGRGIACGVYKAETRVAVVADVEVAPDGEVVVSAMWCAHDCGIVIDPDGVQAQVEGCLVWCVGMVLVEQLPLADRGVAVTGFADYPIARIHQLPRMSVRLIDSDNAPSGAGESAMTAAGAAILNAVHDATGKRPSRLPLQPAMLALPV